MENKLSFLCFRGFIHMNDVNVSFFSTRFSAASWDKILSWNSQRRCSLWKNLNRWVISVSLYCLVLCTSVTLPPSSSFSSSSFPHCCASLPACSAAAILYPATLPWMYWSAWSLPKPHPPQMVPWLLRHIRCSSLDRPQGQIPRKCLNFPLLVSLVW